MIFPMDTGNVITLEYPRITVWFVQQKPFITSRSSLGKNMIVEW